MWSKRKSRNRRLSRAHDVLDVKLRSSQVRAARTRFASIVLGVSIGTACGLYVLWRAGQWGLDRLVYENESFTIRQVEVFSDGVISPDQLRRWSGVKTGQNLLALDLARVKCDLELAPAIQSVAVERILPGTLRIRVTEREPIAQINVPRPSPGGGIEVVVFQVDSEGWVMLPLDPRQRAVPLNQAEDQLPVISGINASELQPGRKIDSAQARTALELIEAFQTSPMSGLVDLKRIDVSTPEAPVVTTGQGSEITLGAGNYQQQLLRWQEIHESGLKMNRIIATLDLAVTNNIPARWLDANTIPPSSGHTAKPQRTRKKDV